MTHHKIPRSSVDRIPFIMDYCRGKKVLHLGCTSSPNVEEKIKNKRWLHKVLTETAAECLGIDIDLEAISMLREKYKIKNIMEGNAETLDKLKPNKFDIILAGELIEHLNNPGKFLETAKVVLKSDGKLLITTTNAFCFRRFIRIPFNKESIHADHVYYFSHQTLLSLAQRFGYVLEEAHSYRIPNKRPLIPYLTEYLATRITPNWGEGIIHVYSVPASRNSS